MEVISPASEACDNNNNLATTTIIIYNNNTKKINVIIFGSENTIETNSDAKPPNYY
jgi:hypothetical protein